MYSVIVEDNEDGSLIERSLDALGGSLSWLDARLRREGVTVHPTCALQRARERTESMRRQALERGSFSFHSPEQAYDFFADAVGADFLSKALHLGASCGLAVPTDRWRFLVKGDPILTRNAPNCRERNLTWETVIASLAASFAKDTAFAEPDVTCEFQGKRFAIAAKVAYTEDGVANAILDGFEQADGKGDASLVMVNASAIYPTRENFGVRDFADAQKAVRCMKPAVDRWCETFGFESLIRRMHMKCTAPIGVTFFVPIFVKVSGMPAPFLYTCLPICWAADTGPDYEFATAFLHACQDVLGFVAADVA